MSSKDTSPEDAQLMLHALRVHQIELEMQNEELRRVQLELDAARARYFDLYDLAPVGYCTVDEAGLILHANLTASALLGLARSELVKRPISRLIIQADQDIYYLLRKQLLESGEPQSCELRMMAHDGTSFWAHLAATAAQSSADAPVLRVVLSDISARKRAEQQLIASEESLRQSALHSQTILDNMADGVITIDAQGLIESFNKAASTIFGYRLEAVLGRNVAMLMPEPVRSHYNDLLQLSQSTGPASIVGLPREIQGQREDGSIFPMSLSVSRISRARQPIYIGIVRDITQHRQDEEEIRRLAFYDPLTGLPNRRLLIDRLKQAMATSRRTGQHGALMFLDLDHFKRLNDTLGHAVGDVLLQQVAIRLKDCVREGDSVARLGGDEFVVLLEGLSIHDHEAAAQTEAVANKILDASGQPYDLLGHTYSSTPSIGIVVFMEEHEAMDELLKKADVAMYQAKSAGRNTVRFYDSATQAAASAHAELEKDMHRDLADNKFVLHYQIQVDADGTPVGAEALVRWNHARLGMLAPAHFIRLAEATGMILPLSQWILDTACAELATWASQPQTARWTMAVNVSESQFSRADFVTTVATALQNTGINARLLSLELTERMLVDDVANSITKMNTLKALGVGFSLDDFGTGYSSLSYLKQLPLDQLKIDQSFVRDVLTNPSNAVIARTVVALGHSLGLTVIAEGVETAAQCALLSELGCDAFQGLHFGPPAPASELARFIGKNTA
ncbi:putative bifunctional diguanylate cyclase/phosphodiesterase [Rhodoferax ferrireducens]|uniref:putative bifunctional diguanylate cyclase/phosphodiesterase n=1 Tax=Rhodoferax ferrireducens TaxID=192843 RepID=UPI000E0D3B92|nr:bifunctional diguanylate cyclase/phosphodiesterase [Rhodoferax ferrireducens]